MPNQLTVPEAQKDFMAKLLPSIKDTLPSVGVTADRFAKVAITALRKNPKLWDCNKASIAECLITSASLGLEPNTPQQHAHLIPYGKECTFMLDYRGMVELARRSGQVLDIYAEVVREGDKFIERKGLHRDLIHEANDGPEEGKLIKAYAVAVLKGSGPTYAIITERDVDKIIKTVKRGKAGDAWKTWPEEMWKKTAIRRLCKLLPSSVLDERAREHLSQEDAEFYAQPAPKLLTGSLDYSKKPASEPANDRQDAGSKPETNEELHQALEDEDDDL